MKHLLLFETNQQLEEALPTIKENAIAFTEEGSGCRIVYEAMEEGELTPGDFIDLGLPSGTKWASRNLGAERPCDYGRYFQWGDTVGYAPEDAKSTWATAPFNNGASEFDGAYFATIKDTVCPNGILAPEYDAIYKASKGIAHMPSKAELDELVANTTHKWVNCTYIDEDHSSHNVYGVKVTGPNGNTIFLPASGGAFEGGPAGDFGSYGSLLGAEVTDGDYSEYGYPPYSTEWGLAFFNDGTYAVDWGTNESAFAIRGVMK